MKLWFLELTAWPTGTHWYAKLRSGTAEDRAEIEIERPLSGSEARLLNRREGAGLFRAGEPTKAFPDRESAIKAAVERVPGDVVILGNWCAADPQEPLAGPPETLDLLQRIYADWTAGNGWRGPDAEALASAWDKALREAAT